MSPSTSIPRLHPSPSLSLPPPCLHPSSCLSIPLPASTSLFLPPVQAALASESMVNFITRFNTDASISIVISQAVMVVLTIFGGGKCPTLYVRCPCPCRNECRSVCCPCVNLYICIVLSQQAISRSFSSPSLCLGAFIPWNATPVYWVWLQELSIFAQVQAVRGFVLTITVIIIAVTEIVCPRVYVYL